MRRLLDNQNWSESDQDQEDRPSLIHTHQRGVGELSWSHSEKGYYLGHIAQKGYYYYLAYNVKDCFYQANAGHWTQPIFLPVCEEWHSNKVFLTFCVLSAFRESGENFWWNTENFGVQCCVWSFQWLLGTSCPHVIPSPHNKRRSHIWRTNTFGLVNKWTWLK